MLSCLFLSGCDPYADVRILNIHNSKWICEEWQAWFVVVDGQAYGKVMMDGKEEEIDFLSDYGSFVWLYSKEKVEQQGNYTDEAMLWEGEAIYAAEKMTLHNATFSRGIFGDIENEAVFIREDLTEEEALSLLEKEGIQLEESSLGGDKTETE